MKITVDRELIESAVDFLAHYRHLASIDVRGPLSNLTADVLTETTRRLNLALHDNPLPKQWAVVEVKPEVTLDIARGHGLDKYVSNINHKVVAVFKTMLEASRFVENIKNPKKYWITEVRV